MRRTLVDRKAQRSLAQGADREKSLPGPQRQRHHSSYELIPRSDMRKTHQCWNKNSLLLMIVQTRSSRPSKRSVATDR